MKIIAFYLPQFHEIPENNAWWGEGFTEWTNVKKAQPLYRGHYQPRIPLGQNYYDLCRIETLVWQTNIARNYGISGFCFYHYWFNGKLLLEKPIELYLNHSECELPFCLCWANESWTNGWVSENNDVIMPQTYGGESEWESHFLYLLKYFKDPRYITKDGKPLLVIYKPQEITNLPLMLDYYQKRALEHGFEGIHFAYQHISYHRTDDPECFRPRPLAVVRSVALPKFAQYN
jgi:lipopolysaccharide biosynthesis protein